MSCLLDTPVSRPDKAEGLRHTAQTNAIASVYAQKAIDQLPRILGLCDREPSSSTFGCFDRPYWHYRTLDFSNGRLQEAAQILALLYRADSGSSAYAGVEKIRTWALGAIGFWAEVQVRDGSLSEVYPNEQSYVATAFSTLAVSEAMQALDSDRHADAVVRSARWLACNENMAVSNQVAGAIAALASAHRLTGDSVLATAAEDKLEQLLSQQSDEGWFPEYGGFDIGYNTICLGHLAHYAVKTGCADARAAAERVGTFIDGRIQDDGSYDPSPTSRKTQYIYPYGLALIDRIDILDRHTAGITQNRILQPAWMDDRFCIPLTLDYIRASEALS